MAKLNNAKPQLLLHQPNIYIYIYTYVSYACVCAKSLQSCLIFMTLWTVAHQAPLSIGFSRQEYWRGKYTLPSSRASSRPKD